MTTTYTHINSNNVDEVLVVCVNLAQQIYRYLKASKRWNCVAGADAERPSLKELSPEVSPTPLIRIISDQSIANAGDSLRELDQLNILTSDPFILVSGDVIANLDLKPILKHFKELSKKDRSTCMISVFKQANRGHATRELLQDVAVTLNEDTKQILGFDTSHRKLGVSMHRDLFKKHPRVSFRYDLLDCGIDICSLQVCTDFASNYDYEDIHKDYLASEVHNVEVGLLYYAHIVENNGYAARIRDLRTWCVRACGVPE